MRRMILAFVVAPLAVPLVFQSLTTMLRGDGGETPISVWGVVLIFSYAVELLLGIPLWLTFRRYRITYLWAYAFTGGLIGWIAGRLILGDMVASPIYRDALCICAGVTATLIFWMIARPSRLPLQ